MPLQIALAAISTALFIAAAAVSSPEWADRSRILDSVRSRPAGVVPQGRALLGLSFFAIVTGIPSALGLIPGLIVVPFGALVLLTYAVKRLSDSTGSADLRWLVVLGISAVSLSVRFKSSDTAAIQGAQAVLGPSVLIEPLASMILALLALITGLVSAVFVVSRTERLPEMFLPGTEPILRWGETALAVSMVTSAAAGPTIAVLAGGLFDLMLAAAVLASTLFGLAATAGVSFLRRHTGKVSVRSLFLGCAGVSTACLLLQLLVR